MWFVRAPWLAVKHAKRLAVDGQLEATIVIFVGLPANTVGVQLGSIKVRKPCQFNVTWDQPGTEPGGGADQQPVLAVRHVQGVDAEGATLRRDPQTVVAMIVLGVGRPADFDFTPLTDPPPALAEIDAAAKIIGLADFPATLFHRLFCAAVLQGPQLWQIVGQLVTLVGAALGDMGFLAQRLEKGE